MLDIKLFRENPGIIKKNLEKRKETEKLKWVDKVTGLDKEYRELKNKLQEMRHRKNRVSEEINELKKQGKGISEKIKEIKSIPEKIKKAEEKTAKLQEQIRYYLMRIPNIMHDSVPYGKDDTENVELRKVGKVKKFDFKLVSHGELAEKLGIADFSKARDVAGAGFYYLFGELALLNRALETYSIDFMTKKGFKLSIPPLALRRKPYEGVTDLSDFENVMYKVEDEDLYLIATSEHPIAAYMMDRVFEEDELPVCIVGFSPCFRKEIGSHGIDTRGLFRVHQFWKVEQFVFCRPEDSWDWHEKLIKNSEDIFKGLGLPFRIVNICTGDLGIVAAKKYDLEVWMPRQKEYKEACSCSNCTDYQARRLNIRYQKKSGEREFVHTLNNTALATSRVMVSILENYQNKDGSITVPEALRQYMSGMKIIKGKK